MNMVITFFGLDVFRLEGLLIECLVTNMHAVTSSRLTSTLFELGTFDKSRTQAQPVTLLGS